MPESLRVLHLSPDFPPVICGIADYTDWLTAELAELGLHVRVLTSLRSLHREVAGVEVSATVESLDRRLWGAVASEVESFRPDVLHVHFQQLMYQGDPAIGFLPWALAMRGRRPAIVTTLHDMAPPTRTAKIVGRLALEALLYGSDRLLVSGDAEYRGVAKRPGLEARATVLPIGSNIQVRPMSAESRRSVRASVSSNENAFLLGYFGLIRPGKGLEVLLESIAELRARSVPVELLVIGDVGDADPVGGTVYRDHLLARRRSLGLQGAVEFVGHVPEDRVSELLQVFDVGVLPFQAGASSSHTSVFAALSHGLPLLTTRGPATPASFTDGAMSLVPAPPEASALAEAIEGLMRDPTQRRSLATKGRELADRFTRRSLGAQIAAIYSGVVGSPAGRQEARRPVGHR